jgi:hypothetical protein
VFAAEVAAEQADGADVVLAQERGLRSVERSALDVDHHELTWVSHGSGAAGPPQGD